MAEAKAKQVFIIALSIGNYPVFKGIMKSQKMEALRWKNV